MVPTQLLGFWPTHSCRTLRSTWGKSLGFPKQTTDFCGLWGAGGSWGYARTHRQAVEDVQRQTSAMARLHRHEDMYDEEDLMSKVQQHLKGNGISLATTMETIKTLTFFGKSTRTVNFQTKITDVQVNEEPVEEVISDDEQMILFPVTPPGEPTESQSDQAMAQVDAEDVQPATVYIPDETTLLELIGTQSVPKTMMKGVSGPGVGSFKPKKDKSPSTEQHWTVSHASLRLHWRGTGQCYRKPGVAYENFTTFEITEPPTFGKDFLHRCRDCFETDENFPVEWLAQEMLRANASSSSC